MTKASGEAPRDPSPRVLVGDQKAQAWAPLLQEPTLVWRVVVVLAVAVAVVGWIDVGLLWYPLHFGSPEWEFGTVSAHFDGMPLATLGLGLTAAAMIGLGWRRRTRLLAVLMALIGLGLAAILMIYALDIPLAFHGVQPQMRSALEKAVVKTLSYGVIYTVLYWLLSLILWRRSRRPT